MSNVNIDIIVQEIGLQLAKVVEESMIQKCLGVLTNDGVYALYLYSFDKLKDGYVFVERVLKINDIIHIQDIQRLNELFKERESKIILRKTADDNQKKELNKEIKDIETKVKDNLNSYFQALSQSLSDLLFFRQLLERSLIYARYHAKAFSGDTQNQ